MTLVQFSTKRHQQNWMNSPLFSTFILSRRKRSKTFAIKISFMLPRLRPMRDMRPSLLLLLKNRASMCFTKQKTIVTRSIQESTTTLFKEVEGDRQGREKVSKD